MADLDKPEELAKAATRVAAYQDRRSQSSGLDKEEIHAFDVGPDDEGFYLRSSDLRALVSQALARRDGVEEPVGDVIEGVQNAIKGLRAHVAAIQADKRAGTNAGSIYNCINDLPNIIRQLEAAEFEIEAEFERYEDARPAPTTPDLRDQMAMAALTGLLAGGWPVHDDPSFQAYILADLMLAERNRTNKGEDRNG